MNFFKRTPSDAEARFLMGRVFVPLSESTTENDACANGPAPIVSTKPAPIDTREVAPAVEANSEIQPIDTHEVVPAVEANSDIPQLEHIVTDPHASTIPGDETSIPSSNPSKKTSLFGGKGIIICAMLSLATGIAVGASWSRTHIFADSSKGQPAVQAAPAAAVVTAPNFNEFQNQLNAIARDLSSVQRNVKELAAGQEHVQQNINKLAAGQEQMRKAQGQLAALQAHLVNLQTLANANQNKQPAPAATEGRKFYRRDYR